MDGHHARKFLRRFMRGGPIAALLVVAGVQVATVGSSTAGPLTVSVTHAYVGGASSGPNCPIVSTGSEASGCSLATALHLTSSGGTVVLETSGAAGHYPGGQFLSRSVVIQPGAGVVDPVIDGQSTSKLLNIFIGGISLTINDVSLINGSNPIGGGGAIDAQRGATLVLHHVSLVNNHGYGGGAISLASGVSTTGTLELDDSTVSGSQAANDGGAIDAANYGGTATVVVKRSMFSNNTGPYSGGAISVGANAGSVGHLQVVASTFVGNTVSQNGGALSIGSYGGTADATILNSTFVANGWNTIGVGGDVVMAGNVVADSVVTGGHAAINCTSPVIDGGYNLEYGTGAVSSTSCGFGGAVTGKNPQLGTLADNGGPSETLMPSATSPLLKAIPADALLTAMPGNTEALCSGTDQRGVTIPQGQPCAIGSVQPFPAAPQLLSLVPNPDGTLTATWAPGSGPPGLPITSYTLTLSPGEISCTTSATTCILRDVRPATAYSSSLTATNAAGTSDPANSLDAITILAATGAPLGALLLSAIGLLLTGLLLSRRGKRRGALN